MAGPKRPEGRVSLENVGAGFKEALGSEYKKTSDVEERYGVDGEGYEIGHGDVVIAAITSCTNTSNPYVLIGAGLLARKAAEKGLTRKPWVKTSLAPGSQVVADYLEASGLQEDLDKIGFQPRRLRLHDLHRQFRPAAGADLEVDQRERDRRVPPCSPATAISKAASRPDVQANYLASPPLVVAHAIAGTVKLDLTKDPIGQDKDGKDVFLKDIWPTAEEVNEYIAKYVTQKVFKSRYADVFHGDTHWREVDMRRRARPTPGTWARPMCRTRPISRA